MRLRFADVALQAGPRTVLAPLSFTLEAGQVGSLYGPARQGKTAALLLAGGYMKGFAGQIWLDQLAVSKEPMAARRFTGLGLIPGLNPLQPRLTVRESLQAEARLQRLPLRERGARVEQVMNQFELASTAGQRTIDLGGAQLFRAGLAVAAIHDPAIYLLDDPADLLTTGEMVAAWTLVRSLAAAGKTVLIASQSAWVAERADLVIRVGKEVAA